MGSNLIQDHFSGAKMPQDDQIPPDVIADEKQFGLHQLDSLSLLLYTFLLTLTGMYNELKNFCYIKRKYYLLLCICMYFVL